MRVLQAHKMNIIAFLDFHVIFVQCVWHVKHLAVPLLPHPFKKKSKTMTLTCLFSCQNQITLQFLMMMIIIMIIIINGLMYSVHQPHRVGARGRFMIVPAIHAFAHTQTHTLIRAHTHHTNTHTHTTTTTYGRRRQTSVKKANRLTS